MILAPSRRTTPSGIGAACGEDSTRPPTSAVTRDGDGGGVVEHAASWTTRASTAAPCLIAASVYPTSAPSTAFASVQKGEIDALSRPSRSTPDRRVRCAFLSIEKRRAGTLLLHRQRHQHVSRLRLPAA